MVNYTYYVQCSNTRKDRTIINPKDSKVMSNKITRLAREIMEIKEGKKKNQNPTKNQLLGSPLFAIAAWTLRVHLSHVLKLWP